MRKIISIVITVFLAFTPLTALGQSIANQAPISNFQAIVTVNSYTEDIDGFLSLYAQGSGVIISSDGLILTNRHVIYTEEFDGSERPSTYQICIPATINSEPDCFYTGAFIAANKDLDIALLQLRPIVDLGKNPPYQSITWNLNDLTETNDPVTTLGYPDIGGKTLTVGKGSVAGSVAISGKNWLKIDAISSFGSSGGAAVNAQGKLIGITTAGNSDYAGSLGYVMDIATLVPWIAANRNLPAQKSALISRLETFSKVKNNLKTTDVYKHATPPFTLTKPSTWKFGKTNENTLIIHNENDPESGYLSLNVGKYVGNVDIDGFIEKMKNSWAMMGILPFTEITKKTPITLKGATAYRIRTSSKGSVENSIIILSGEYITFVTYDYGKDEKDQKIIDEIVTSMVFEKSLPPAPSLSSYTNPSKPDFNLKITKNWLAKALKSKSSPLILWHRKYLGTKIEVTLKKTDENTKGMTNAEYIAQEKLNLNQSQKEIDAAGLKIKVALSNDNFKLNENLQNVMMIEFLTSKKGSAKAFLYNRDYIVKTGDKILTVSLYVSSSNKKVQAAALKDFDKLLKTLQVKK